MSLAEVDGELKYLDSRHKVRVIPKALHWAGSSGLLRSFATKKLIILAVRYKFMACSEAP